jgi:hypothetical protein
MRLATAFAVSGALLVAPAARAQGRFPPDSLVNVKFFPATMSVRELINRMRFFTFALGVRCQYCHIGQEGQPLDSFNFRSDDKRTKLTARVMLEMVRQINTQHLTLVPERPTPNVDVSCLTCHRGVARPRDLGAIIVETVRQSGLDSAVRVYRGLREQYYGRAAYDFGEASLASVSDGLLSERRYDDAVAILRLDAEFFPNSAEIYGRIGEAFRLKGDTASAIANYRQAIQIDPRAPLAARRLRELGQSPN